MERQSFDQEYVRKLTQGDPEVSRHFTDYFSELLQIKLRFRLRSPQLAEDARQETFLRVFSTLRKGGIEQPDRLGAFVNSVCNNVIFEQLRSHTRASQMPENHPDPPDPRFSAESHRVTEERKSNVRKVIDSLPERDRQVLKMVFLEEKDREEVCSIMKIESEYLRVLLHRAKSRLKTEMTKVRLHL